MIRNILMLVLAGTLLFGFVTVTVHASDQGPSAINIFGGSRGDVPFPHAQHQARIKDCNICHSAFPQEADAMKKMKEKGSLKPKKVMNLQCIKCHKADKRAGKPYGPVTCNTCHIK